MKTIVCFLSRAHGYAVLEYLLKSKEYTILQVFTHKLNPVSQDSKREIRSDYHLFDDLCVKYKIPLYDIDSKNTEISISKCDFLVEVSWRYLIPKIIISQTKVLAFGIHRGKLPEYAGASPIQQALEQNEHEIVVSAHYLEQKIDAGQTILSMSHPVQYDNDCDLDKNIQRLRDEITPLFSEITKKVIQKFS